MNLSDAIDAFLVDRRAKGATIGTLRNERSALRGLLADAGNIQVRRLRPQHLDTFWSHHAHWGPGTKNRVRGTLMVFFAWCRTRGYMGKDSDPIEGMRKLRVPPRDRIIIPQSEFEPFLDTAEESRDRAILALGIYLFLRASETEELRWRDLDFDSHVVHVYRPKTQTIDILPMCIELERELKRWRLAYIAHTGSPPRPDSFVIPAYEGGGGGVGEKGTKGFVYFKRPEWILDQRSYTRMRIRQHLDKAGYYRPYEGGHTLRRSGATALYNQLTSVGHDRAIRICQAMLGHASVQTTEIYLRLDLDRRVRNDLLSGERMFPEAGTAQVIELGAMAHGREDVHGVRV